MQALQPNQSPLDCAHSESIKVRKLNHTKLCCTFTAPDLAESISYPPLLLTVMKTQFLSHGECKVPWRVCLLLPKAQYTVQSKVLCGEKTVDRTTIFVLLMK